MKTTRVARSGMAAERLAVRLLRAAGIGLLAVILALLIATLPPVDTGAGLVATAFADDGGSGKRGGLGGVRRGTFAGDEDDDLDPNDDRSEDGARGDVVGAGAGRDIGGGIGNGGGNGSGRGQGGGRGNGGGQPGDGYSGTTGERDSKGGGRDGDHGRERGGERDAGAGSRDFAADSLEDQGPATGASTALDALRATVLSADEEAAAIATGWAPAD